VGSSDFPSMPYIISTYKYCWTNSLMLKEAVGRTDELEDHHHVTLSSPHFSALPLSPCAIIRFPKLLALISVSSRHSIQPARRVTEVHISIDCPCHATGMFLGGTSWVYLSGRRGQAAVLCDEGEHHLAAAVSEVPRPASQAWNCLVVDRSVG
jgi:hypothetical protein